METPFHYEVAISWTEGSRGILQSPVLEDAIACSTPPEFAGGEPGFWSPEHLFTAAVNSCFMATFLAIAGNMKLALQSFHCNAVGTVDRVDGQYLIKSVNLYPDVLLLHSGDITKAARVLEKAKAACLVSHSIQSEVILHPSIH